MNLLDLLQACGGKALKKKGNKDGGEFAGPCPFCNEGDDRFRVWPFAEQPTWWCRVCGKRGGSISLLMGIKDVPHRTAVQELRDMGYPLDEAAIAGEWVSQERKLEPPTRKHFDVDTNADQVEAWAIEGRAKAIAYFGQWGLTPDDVDRAWLGWGTYKGRSGYTIPHWWIENGQHYLKGVKMRHETQDHKRRFSSVDGSNTRGFYNMKWVSNPDGTRQGPLLNHLFIVEAEKDAILLDGMGYPTVSFLPEAAWMQYLYRALANVVVPILIYDEDGGKGLNRALLIRERIKSKPIITSTKAYNVKSPSDLAQAQDRDILSVWIKSISQDIEVYETA